MSDFDGGIAHHASPHAADYSAYDVEIVSPEVPCGSAWLVNCLLELRVPVWKPWNMRDANDWERLRAYRYRYTNLSEPLRFIVPALSAERCFDFLPAPVPRVFHYWPGFYGSVSKTILFVRDPRDALHSVWRRALSLQRISPDTDLVRFVRANYFHYPLSWGEYVVVFLRLWRLWLADRTHLILRYEDYRTAPVVTLRRAVAFLGLVVDEADLKRASEASSFERLYRSESMALAAGTEASRINRAGIANEHRQIFDAKTYAAFDSRYDELFQWLGYDPNPVHNEPDPPTSFDPASLLAAMRIDEAQAQFQPWLRREIVRVACDTTSSLT